VVYCKNVKDINPLALFGGPPDILLDSIWGWKAKCFSRLTGSVWSQQLVEDHEEAFVNVGEK
jgi:hypothetical protein